MTRIARTIVSLVGVLALVTACDRSADLAPRLTPAERILELRTTRLTADSAFLLLHLSGAESPVLGSVTASVSLDAREWTFSACAPIATEALVACHQAETDLRIAAAWASGAPTGGLVTLTLVRKSGTAVPALRLTATELHSAFGHSLTDSITVRREGTP